MTDDDRKRLRRILATIDLNEAVRRRAVQDAINEALGEYWRRRARDLDAARPRPGDYPGQASFLDRVRRSARLGDAVAACRIHAALIESGYFLDDDAELPAGLDSEEVAA